MINCSFGDDGVPTRQDVCEFTCDDGFELMGRASLRCQRNLMWNGVEPTCVGMYFVYNM